jgi:hypothetical protein
MRGQHWLLRDAFAYFGAKAANPRSSWSARSGDGTTIVLTLWDDEIEDDGKTVTTDSFNSPTLPIWRNRAGNRDRIKNLRLAQENAEGLFRVVIVTARDLTAEPRAILRRYPHPTLVMHLDELNETTGEFRATSVTR